MRIKIVDPDVDKVIPTLTTNPRNILIIKKPNIWTVLEENLNRSNCLKAKTSACLIKNGKILSVGFNQCAPGQCEYGDVISSCPRMQVKTGTEYELCASIHAEVMACLNVRPKRTFEELAKFAAHKEFSADKISSAFTEEELKLIKGSYLYLFGHYWICEKCEQVIRILGVKETVLNEDSKESTKSDYQKRGLM